MHLDGIVMLLDQIRLHTEEDRRTVAKQTWTTPRKPKSEKDQMEGSGLAQAKQPKIHTKKSLNLNKNTLEAVLRNFKQEKKSSVKRAATVYKRLLRRFPDNENYQRIVSYLNNPGDEIVSRVKRMRS